MLDRLQINSVLFSVVGWLFVPRFLIAYYVYERRHGQHSVDVF